MKKATFNEKKSSKIFRAGALALAVAATLFSACNKEQLEPAVSSSPHGISAKSGYNDGEIVLGQQIGDPYRYETMLAAFKMLNGPSTSSLDTIEPTGKYVKVFINDDNDLMLLEDDTNIVWFDYPLDYEILVDGCYYHDPSLPEQSTWKYAVIPLDYQVPGNLDVKLIYKVFIPEDMQDSNFYYANEDFFDKLDEISTDLSGYSKYENSLNGTIGGTASIHSTNSSSKWTPSATIKVWDDTLNSLLPVHGAAVVVKRGTKVRRIFTDKNGYCWTRAQFKANQSVKYSIVWERAHWDIRDNMWQAYYTGPSQSSHWDLNIYPGGKSFMYATIHRALLFAFYSPSWVIESPRASHKLKVAYNNHTIEDVLGYNICFWNILGIRNNIVVYGRNSDNTYRKSNGIISTTFHELGHQSLLRFVGNINYKSKTSFIRESWSRCVQLYFTNELYHQAGLTTYDDNGGFQHWNRNDTNYWHYPYTPVFIDLIDDYNQNVKLSSEYCNDNISEYGIKELQDDVLPDVYGLYSLKQKLLELKRHNSTESEIITMLSYYEGLDF
ncbi:MAG: hypothetical protein IJ789_06635 [Bacteroidales bacterium]|nr:hypothetical protein [Bacteroidales bacterium]